MTYRGVAVGRVDRLRLADDGVHVDLRLERGVTVPARHRCRGREPVGGRRAVRRPAAAVRRAGRSSPTATGSPATGPAPRCTPRPCCSTWTGWSTRSTSGDLVVVIDELGRGVLGHRAGPAAAARLRRRPDPGGGRRPARDDPADRGRRRPCWPPSGSSGSAIKSFSADLADLSDTLRTSDGDLRKVLDNGVVASQQLQTLIRDQPDRDLGPAGQPAGQRAGHGGPAGRRRAGAGHLPGQRGRRLHRGPGRRHLALRPGPQRGRPARSAPRATAAPTSGPRRTPPTCPPTPTRGAPLPRGSASSVRGAQNAPAPSGAVRRAPFRGGTNAGRDGQLRFTVVPDRVRPDQRAGDGRGQHRRSCSGPPAASTRHSERTHGHGCCSDR